MENENKNLQDELLETEMDEKVRQDVSEKIAAAAAEIQDEIDSASAAEEIDVQDEVIEEEIVLADEDASDWDDESFVEEKPEPKKVTLKLANLIYSWVGSAIAGALILALCLQLPTWFGRIPQGSTVAKVNGVAITDADLEYYIYNSAMEYFSSNKGVATDPAEFDWEAETVGGTHASKVKDMALEDAINDALYVSVGKDLDWSKKDTRKANEIQAKQMVSVYGKKLIDLNALAQGHTSLNQQTRAAVRMANIAAVQADISANPDKYYPQDLTVLNTFAANDKCSAKHILIKTDDTNPLGDEALIITAEEAHAKAEEILAKIKNGEDFDALMEEFNEDEGEPAEGYTFGSGEMVAEFEAAAFALGLNEVSEVVDTTFGSHIIKRVPGLYELEGYFNAQAKISKKEKAIEKISVGDIVKKVEKAAEDFQTAYSEYQGAQ